MTEFYEKVLLHEMKRIILLIILRANLDLEQINLIIQSKNRLSADRLLQRILEEKTPPRITGFLLYNYI